MRWKKTKRLIIKFNAEEFKLWLDNLGCDCCDHYVYLEDNKVICKWESNIYGKITKYKDIELEGKLDFEEMMVIEEE